MEGDVHHPDEPHPRWYVPHVAGDPLRFLGPDGMPTVRLIPYTDWRGERVLRLCDDATGLLVAPKDGRLRHAGLISAQVMGEKYAQDACRLGDFSVGAPVLLVPEPENPHDNMAVAVYDAANVHRCGYLSRNRARLYHSRVAAGDVVAAISVRGTPAGHPCEQVGILAATPEVLRRVRSSRPPDLPRPAFA